MSDDSSAQLLTISTSPHVRHPDSVQGIMVWVVAALVPAGAASVYFFGTRSLLLIAVSVIAAVAAEFLITRFLTRKPAAILDFSAVVTGILLAYNLPPEFPWWMAVLGSVFAVGVAKQAFGGLGHNFVNPALAARAFLMAAYPTELTRWTPPRLGTLSGIDGLTQATPLANFAGALTSGNFEALDFQEALPNLFLGNVGGCLGETSALALILGAGFLWYKRIIGFRVPFTYVGTVFLLFWLFNGTGDLFSSDALIIPSYQVLAGGLLLGALFMATDMVTSPITPGGKVVFGAGCGVLTFLIRKFGGYPEGVSYSILLMNLVVPLLDRYTRPRIYGRRKSRG